MKKILFLMTLLVMGVSFAFAQTNADIKFDRSNVDRNAERELYEKQNGLNNEITNYKVEMKEMRKEFNELKVLLGQRKIRISSGKESD